MPVEIRELVIRATVVEEGGNSHQDTPSQGAEPSQTFLEECVRQVLTILKNSGER